MQLQRSGLTKDDAVAIGKGLNARKIVLGSVRKFGDDTYYLTVRVVDVETQQIEAQRSGTASDDSSRTIETGRFALALEFRTPPRPRTTPGGNPWFDVALAQRGEAMPIRNGEAGLVAEPFDLVVTLASREGIYVHVSPESAVFDRARRNESLAQTFAAFNTIAVQFGNKDETLRLNNDESHAFWMYEGPQIHSFTSVERHGLAVRAVRRVASITPQAGSATALGVWTEPLYLVFYGGELAGVNQDARAAERQRLALKLTFSPPVMVSILPGETVAHRQDCALVKGRQVISVATRDLNPRVTSCPVCKPDLKR
jgi:hypothetical protein